MNRKPKIDEFDNLFSSTVLDEGLEISYFKENWKVEDDEARIKGIYKDSNLPPVHIVINKTQQFLLNFSCDCIHFNEKNGCKHVAGLLYLLRNKSVRLVPVSGNRKVSIETVLEVINPMELAAFIRFYASNNLVFNKLIKQYFSYKFIPSDKDFDDYLHEIILSYMNVDGRLESKGKRLLFQIFEMHLLRAEQMVHQNDYSSAAEIIKSILNRFYQFDFETNSKPSRQLIAKVHETLYLIVNQDIAPVLRRKIDKLGISLILSHQYNYFKKPNIVDIAAQSPDVISDEVSKVIEEKINACSEYDKYEWLYQLFLFENSVRKFNLISFYIRYLDNDENLINFLNIVKRENPVNSQVDRILEICILKSNLLLKPVSSLIADYLIRNRKIELYCLLTEKIIDLSIPLDQLHSYISFNLAIEIKDVAVLFAKSEILSKIKAEMPEDYLKILFRAKDYESLLSVIEEFSYYEELPDFIPELALFNTERLTSVLLQNTKKYLDVHLGIHSVRIVEEIRNILDKYNLVEVLESFRNFIFDNYSDRKHLIKSI